MGCLLSYLALCQMRVRSWMTMMRKEEVAVSFKLQHFKCEKLDTQLSISSLWDGVDIQWWWPPSPSSSLLSSSWSNYTSNCWDYSIDNNWMNGYGVLAEWCWWQKTDVFERKHVSVPLCPPKFHMKWPGNEPRHPWWKISDCLRYGMATNHHQPFLHIKLGWRSVGRYTFWPLYLVLTWGQWWEEKNFWSQPKTEDQSVCLSLYQLSYHGLLFHAFHTLINIQQLQ